VHAAAAGVPAVSEGAGDCDFAPPADVGCVLRGECDVIRYASRLRGVDELSWQRFDVLMSIDRLGLRVHVCVCVCVCFATVYYFDPESFHVLKTPLAADIDPMFARLEQNHHLAVCRLSFVHRHDHVTGHEVATTRPQAAADCTHTILVWGIHPTSGSNDHDHKNARGWWWYIFSFDNRTRELLSP
jgi:hypothetical protein